MGGKVTALQKCGTLAQLVEQRTFNPFVVGSTPARPTKFLYEGLVKNGELNFIRNHGVVLQQRASLF